MAESIWAISILSMGMILAGLLLCVGLYVGYKAGKCAAPVTRLRRGGRRLALFRHELQQCVSLAQQAARRAEQLTVMASAAQEGSGRRALAGAQDLLELSATLSQRLEQLLRGTRATSNKIPGALPASTQTISDRQHERQVPRVSRAGTASEETHSRLSAQELGQITETENCDGASADDLDRQHYSYDCIQSILPWTPDDDFLPAPTDGVSVRCHDISGKGISFFWPTQPQFEHFIISLGSDREQIFMACQVMRFKPAELDGAAMYLVGCRFIRRMAELKTSWAARPTNAQAVASVPEPALV
jgi:hypothetical protein